MLAAVVVDDEDREETVLRVVEHLADDRRRGLAGPDDRDPHAPESERTIARLNAKSRDWKRNPPRKYVTTSAPRMMTERGIGSLIAKLTPKSTTPEPNPAASTRRASAMLA